MQEDAVILFQGCYTFQKLAQAILARVGTK